MIQQSIYVLSSIFIILSVLSLLALIIEFKLFNIKRIINLMIRNILLLSLIFGLGTSVNAAEDDIQEEKSPTISVDYEENIYDIDENIYYSKTINGDDIELSIVLEDEEDLDKLEVYINEALTNTFEGLENGASIKFVLENIDNINSFELILYNKNQEETHYKRNLICVNHPDIQVNTLSENVIAKENDYYFNSDLDVNIAISSPVGIRTVLIKLGDKTIVAEEKEDVLGVEYSVNPMDYEDFNYGKLYVYVEDIFGYTNLFDSNTYIKDNIGPSFTSIDANTYDILLNDDYNYYSNSEISINLNALDMDCSNLKYNDISAISYELFDANGNSISDVNNIKTVKNEDNTYTGKIIINKSFKGFIRFYAMDELGNTSFVNTSRIILESNDNINEIFTAEITPNSEKIHNSNTAIDINIKNDYAGIKEILISVESKFDKENNYKKYITTDDLGDTGFEIKNKDRNIITELSGKIPVHNNSNNINIKVEIIDNAGNKIIKNSQLSIDKTPPEIEVDFNKNLIENYLNDDLIAKVVITERNFDENKFKINISSENKSDFTRGSFSHIHDKENPDNDKHITYITFDKDDDYIFGAEFIDDAGNKIVFSPVSFIIDKTPPRISLSYDRDLVNQKYINEKRQAIINVVEKNFDPQNVIINGSSNIPSLSSWSSQGDVHTATLDFVNEGLYTINISAHDKAHNKSKSDISDSFEIDMTAPTISFLNIENNSAYNDIVTPKIVLNDNNLDKSGNKLFINQNGSKASLDYKSTYLANELSILFSNISMKKENDGIYEILMESRDLAGNKASKSIQFSVNRFGSTYLLDNNSMNIKNKYITSPIDIKITEINVDKIKNDNLCAYLSKNGNTKILSPQKDFNIQESNSGYKHSLSYIFPKELFTDDGVYLLSMYSVDLAGNKNQSLKDDKLGQVSFGIDKTAPLIYGLNLNDGDRIDNEKYDTQMVVKDNLKIENIDLYVNNQKKEYKQDDEVISFDLDSDEKPQSIYVVARDAAGNHSEARLNNIYIYPNIENPTIEDNNDIKSIPKRIMNDMKKIPDTITKSIKQIPAALSNKNNVIKYTKYILAFMTFVFAIFLTYVALYIRRSKRINSK